MDWDVMGAGHLTSGVWGRGGSGMCPDVAYPTRTAGSTGIRLPARRPGAIQHGLSGRFGGAEHLDVLLSDSTARSEYLMRSSPTSSAVRSEA